MTASLNTTLGKDYLVIDFTGEAAIGLQGNIPNPEGCTLLITNSYFYLATPSTAAATLNAGIAASGVDDSSLHGALPLDGGAGTCWMGYHPAVTQDASLAILWSPTNYLTLTTAAASALPCIAKLFVKYIRVE